METLMAVSSRRFPLFYCNATSSYGIPTADTNNHYTMSKTTMMCGQEGAMACQKWRCMVQNVSLATSLGAFGAKYLNFRKC